MESASSLCVLPSHGPPFFQEDNAISETSSRALQLSSGNVGSIPAEPRFDFLKAEFDDQHGQEETTVFNTQTTSREGNHPQAYQRKRQRQRRDGRRQYPWDRDRNFIRYELNSERYRAYRLKCQQGNDQVWPDDVEDCLQYGKCSSNSAFTTGWYSCLISIESDPCPWAEKGLSCRLQSSTRWKK